MTHKQLLSLKYLDVFGCRYQIKYPKKVKYEGAICDGLCLHDSKIIKIDASLPDERKIHVLLHEMMHAALRESSADEPLVVEHEEIIVETLSKFFFRLFFKSKGM
jgi:Zn-dependent peptidase ImmA (M78 family)